MTRVKALLLAGGMSCLSLICLTGASQPPSASSQQKEALPEQGPVPDPKPKTADDAKPAQSEDPQATGKSSGKGDDKTDGKTTDAPTQNPAGNAAGQAPVPAPETVPVPKPSPAAPPSSTPAAPDAKSDAAPGKAGGPSSAPTETATPPAPPPPPPIMAEDPAAYAQCLIDLKAEGAEFTEKPKIDDGNGCGIDKPLEVTAILPGVTLKPKGTLRCAAALELSQWLKTVVIPAADQALPDKGKLKGIDQASTYICRNRNSLSTGKMSEHAKGNAIDIAGLEFEKGPVPMKIVPDSEPTLPGAFQRTVNASACLYFTTVLAPGADETHKDHLHLDLIKRRNDYRVCQEPD
ncbi:extensin-like domain-containing protein [Allorhizobium taibaishanense]|uniref:Extensin-like C-terminal domain-containing protein n=2 Tax=Allorhizobium taibaishanense TaxID=887144 RepID=A0A7W6MSU7_9HYPH|nr:extensin family protein [Allorhizobium taibaishanense]MBB4006393.1 hypothetical protein [Allorhizobium taibaishanense]